ncbi:Uncharacterized protein BP5553_03881 [Venustampulla echinocandica]|uniref:Methyltransferase domain-containing protein n=1 Tax=Venustampulla echinocandica TaxID=2656787 RepID=A0A370TVI8_9HELO|nr:Uncharacterized protein BP5553_03881 [Venustampulla echinocandica]RDL39541.1 Uncharacterized protein BP5553_03881 [Venustampulla echinocandica]
MSTGESFHSKHAAHYDRGASGATLSIAKIIVRDLPLPITDDSNILDSACGTGLVTAVIKSKYPTARILGSDIAPGMISIYEARAKENNWPSVSSAVLDVRDLKTLEDDTFSHVITNFGIMAPTFQDKEAPLKVARETWRVLKSGGVSIISTWAERNFDKAFEATALTIRPNEQPYSWDIGGDYCRGFYLMKQLEEAGFGSLVEVKSAKGKVEANSLDELVENMMFFKDMFFKGYDDEELARVPDILKEKVKALEKFKQTEDGVEIEMVAWIGVGWK